MRARLGCTLLLCTIMGAVCGVAETPRAALLVLAKTDHTLSVIDPSSLQVVGRVPSGPDPHEVIASSDGRFAYISNYGGGAYNTITVAELSGPKSSNVIDLGALRGPHGLVFQGGKLWFTAEGAKVMGSYNPSTSKIDWVLGTGQNRTHMIYVFPDLKRIVTSNIASATMTIADKGAGAARTLPPGAPQGGAGAPPQTARGPGGPGGPSQIDWDETVIPVGRGAEGFDVSPDGKEIWAANAQDGTISIIDVASKKVAQTLEANVTTANRLKFTPDGKLVFVSSLRSPELAIFDAQTRKDAKRVKIGRGAAGLLMQPDGARAYVACTPDDYVAIIDLKTLEVTGHIQAGKQPDGLAWAVRQ